MEIQKLTVAEKITLAEALWDSVAEQEMDLDLTMEKHSTADWHHLR